MPYKLYPPGSRRRTSGKFNTTYVVRGSLGGARFEVVADTTDRAAAKKFAEDFLVRFAQQAVAPEHVTFAYAAEAYRLKRQPGPIDDANIRRLVGHFGNAELARITGADLIAAAHELLPGQSNASKNRNVITVASAILHYGAQQEPPWCKDARHQRLKESRRSPRQPAKDSDLQAIVANVDLTGFYRPQKNAYTKGPRIDRNAAHKKLLLAVLYETGLRISDLLRLADEAINRKRQAILCHASKTDETSWLGVSEDLMALLAATPRMEDGRLFPWQTKWGVYKWLRPLVRELGITYTPHMSRHALATQLDQAGLSGKQIAARGLWGDARSVARYIHASAPAPAGRTAASLWTSPVRGVGVVVPLKKPRKH